MTADDRLELRGLRVLSRCGVLPEELERDQPFEIGVDVGFDARPAGQSDALADTVDYGSLVELITTVAADRHNLMERFAERIAEAVLTDPLATAVTVTVTKLRPPVPHDLATAGVKVRRTR
jgi:dihydroneopterin aldolase